MTKPSTPAASIRSEKTDALFQVRLLAALRSGDPGDIHPFLAEIGRQGQKSAEKPDSDLAATTLHLAIRCASHDTIGLLVAHRSISPNAICPPGSQVSALHLAASLGRVDVVRLLLEQPEIDDTVRDDQNRSVLDVATKEVKQAIQESRDSFAHTYLSLLREYVASPLSSPPPPALVTMLSSPRIKLIDLSTLDGASGTSVLHEAVRRKDLRLVELLVRAGADVFVRDRKGRAVGEGEKGHGKADDQVKVFLRQFTNRETTLIDTSASEPPTLKGYLNKYTNVARGYNTRWFVLKDGMLSYYRHQDDENLAGRGSISMRNARLKASHSDRLRFEISSTPTRSGSSAQKWWMRANHPVEVARWVQALNRNIEWYARAPASSNLPSSSTPLKNGGLLMGRPSYASDSASVKTGPSSDNASIYASSWKSSRKSRIGERPERPHSPHGSMDSAMGDESGDQPTALAERTFDREDAESTDSSQASRLSQDQGPPFREEILLHANSIQAQIKLSTQLLASQSNSSDLTPAKAAELHNASTSCMELVATMFDEYLSMKAEREAWFERRYQREKEKGAMWETSLGLVVGESETLEQDLLRLRKEKKGMRKALRASMLVTGDVPGAQMGTIKAKNKLEPSISQDPQPPSVPEVQPPPAIPTPSVIISPPPKDVVPLSSQLSLSTDSKANDVPAKTDDKAETTAEHTDDGMESEDSSDEFFDAVDAGNIPNLVVTAPLVSPVPMDPATETLIDIHQYEGYAHPRTKLPISSDNRPPVSLWAVLKSSVGKDLTRISFPVFFNEPTSMLQRMAEDMEFAECLDAAAAERDPQKRIAFVAAFAMSNYSSTIGRIAKPFNPMLGETFEYCNVNRQYRYVSEQVSHHPPMSACWAESPSWHYYGEVDAKNKFMGKSFEIRPTGVAHADLMLPPDYVSDPKLASKYPRNPGRLNKGHLVEHYSWKKVTTNISGFIVGNPTIDHYGDMTVVNHRTGDKCVLTFKPRGWSVSTACEIKGAVTDARGRVTWDIAGRWNGQLVARRAGSGSGHLLPDVSLSGAPGPGQPECILLWRNTEKPPAPFNLTPFAITLNDCPPDTLGRLLPLTDCRLRPDQRAFENGQYEKANDLKLKNEDLQRATRRRRENGDLPPHKPRWFEATTEPDTGERVWAPLRVGERLAYWLEREKVWKSDGEQRWSGVDKIFADEE